MKTKLLLLAFSLSAALSSAQTAVQLLPSPKMQFMDSTGTVPLALGKVCTYQAGTSTPLATYTDSTGSVQNSNPVILDTAGRAQIWWGTAAYKVTLLTPGTDNTCSTGSQVWSIDNVSQKYFRLDGSNVLTPISDPSVALGEFWLSSTNPGFLKWSDASAIHTVVGADSTQTLSNKTLAAPTLTGTTLVNRIRANQGTALIAGDFALSAGFGNTASVGSILGTDAAFSVVVTSAGTGQGANPTLTLTFHDGTWTNSPLCTTGTGPGNDTRNAIWAISSVNATTIIFQLIDTPVAGSHWGMTATCTGR